MPETKKAIPTPVNPWETDKATWQYVTIPSEDVTGKKYETIRLNKYEFEAGQTYQVPPPVAQFLNERMQKFNRSITRLFNGRADMEALRVVPAGSAPAGQTTYVDASQINTL